jgi:hypothetical protein
MELNRYKITNNTGKLIWKEGKEVAFHTFYSIINQGEDETLDDQNDDGETNTILVIQMNEL